MSQKHQPIPNGPPPPYPQEHQSDQLEAPATQVPQPRSSNWENGICSCFSQCDTCLMSCCLPCITYGKTQTRMRDPSLRSYSALNGDCLIFGLLSLGALNWIIQTSTRAQMRRNFSIEGSCCGDCLTVFFCPCCAVGQEEMEAQTRLQGDQTGYRMSEGMNYPS
ncbi:PLAC8 family-domain-containing protein [Emericellopsis atlantica]|uniref:PLAC8 family-domain-containing protein n=1 Tax=Emericellopsis atlantica TaxID=2614577 RepID=A0A9P8CMY8_9HYPO|nr:PLAC8 family-domain-containing protein [Emericellopsis atlantica]KAG9253214.1 PLAC8 family-domain-containing protein [Emericellopsis atlantica]